MDKSNNIHEEFLEFGKCEQLSGKLIATEIIGVVQKSNLDIKSCCGQGYDGASKISSETVDVQKQIPIKNKRFPDVLRRYKKINKRVKKGGK